MNITEKELAEALEGFDHEELDYQQIARRVSELLNTPLAPEKPEPGTLWVAYGDNVAYVDEEGVLQCIQTNGARRPFAVDDGHGWEPAHVISEEEYRRLVSIRADEDANPADAQYAPAKPPVLTESEVRELWNFSAGSAVHNWSALGEYGRMAAVDMAWKVLARHSEVRELPSRNEVSRTICRAMADHINPRRCEILTDAMMVLLKGDDRG